jgi:hypothetical protein
MKPLRVLVALLVGALAVVSQQDSSAPTSSSDSIMSRLVSWVPATPLEPLETPQQTRRASQLSEQVREPRLSNFQPNPATRPFLDRDTRT